MVLDGEPDAWGNVEVAGDAEGKVGGECWRVFLMVSLWAGGIVDKGIVGSDVGMEIEILIDLV